MDLKNTDLKTWIVQIWFVTRFCHLICHTISYLLMLFKGACPKSYKSLWLPRGMPPNPYEFLGVPRGMPTIFLKAPCKAK